MYVGVSMYHLQLAMAIPLVHGLSVNCHLWTTTYYGPVRMKSLPFINQCISVQGFEVFRSSLLFFFSCVHIACYIMPSRSGQRRVLTRRKKKARSVQPIVPIRSPKKRKKWTQEQMASAIEAVKSGSGINRAALNHGIPPTSLKNRLSGHVKDGTLPGPRPYLTSDEENELATFLVDCAAIGFGKPGERL